jgi:hypothetical protein
LERPLLLEEALQRVVRAAIGFAADSLAAVSPAVAVLTKEVSNVMLRKTLGYVALLACGALTLAGLTASADDKKDDKDKAALSGAWVKKAGELKIDFCDKDVLKIYPHGNEVIVMVCKYTSAKDGRVKAKLTEFEGKEEAKEKAKEKVPLGLEFSFKWKVKDDTATLGDLKGKGDTIEHLKSHLEGEYEQKK